MTESHSKNSEKKNQANDVYLFKSLNSILAKKNV